MHSERKPILRKCSASASDRGLGSLRNRSIAAKASQGSETQDVCAGCRAGKHRSHDAWKEWRIFDRVVVALAR